MTCSVDDCTAPVHGRGWCRAHYMRWWRTGDPTTPLLGHRTGPNPDAWQPVAPRFWAKVDRSDPDGCWLWTGSRRHLYGEMFVNGAKVYAHRVSYEIENGPVPEGLVVRHRCDTPLCVRPDHLIAGTQAENMRDCGDRERWRNQHGAGRNAA